MKGDGPLRAQSEAESQGAAIGEKYACYCKIDQLLGAERDVCQTDTGHAPVLNGKSVDGWCYVDPITGQGSEKIVKDCPADSRRELRFVNGGKPGAEDDDVHHLYRLSFPDEEVEAVVGEGPGRGRRGAVEEHVVVRDADQVAARRRVRGGEGRGGVDEDAGRGDRFGRQARAVGELGRDDDDAPDGRFGDHERDRTRAGVDAGEGEADVFAGGVRDRDGLAEREIAHGGVRGRRVGDGLARGAATVDRERKWRRERPQAAEVGDGGRADGDGDERRRRARLRMKGVEGLELAKDVGRRGEEEPSLAVGAEREARVGAARCAMRADGLARRAGTIPPRNAAVAAGAEDANQHGEQETMPERGSSS